MAMVIKILLTKKYKPKGLKVVNSDQEAEKLRGGGLIGMMADAYNG